MSALAVMRYEQGLYLNPSKKLTNYLEVSETAYQAWRTIHQESARIYFKPFPRPSLDFGQHPFVNLRQTISQRAVGTSSQMSFCVLLALHPSTVAEYEKGHLIKLPSAIRVALYNAGLSESQINELDELGRWYNERSGH
jgi:hypothetical protein